MIHIPMGSWMKINVLILAASSIEGDGSSPNYPICLHEIGDETVLQVIMSKLAHLEDAIYSFAVLSNDIRKFHVDNIVEILQPGSNVFSVSHKTMGSACTALLASCRLKGDEELIIISSNEIVDVDINKVVIDFRSRKLDAGTVTFQSIHPRYSYVKLDQNGLVVEAAQQKPISHNATTGIFWFRTVDDFICGAKKLMLKRSNTNEQYYIAPIFNELILFGKAIGAYEISNDKYTPLKSLSHLNASQIKYE